MTGAGLAPPSLANGWQTGHATRLLASFRHFVGRPLLQTGALPAHEAARLLYFAPFVVVSHDGAADPVLTYGNRMALSLWETDWPSLTAMPSRLTAEPVHRDERARLLQATEDKGYIDNYSGIRISTSGRRFRIERAIVWTLIDEDGHRIGQAATFRDFDYV
ncbi:MAG: MEKHLA domain-containing protein [Alphaproteobacteria bacterium]|jgi:hypothetical protein|nr:MEKHLA domain-containing protein [Alphaproteobacteria bacterium]